MTRIIMTSRAVPTGASLLLVIILIAGLCETPAIWGQEPNDRARVTLDFNEVDLPVFIRYISELSGKHFILDERVTGKITIDGDRNAVKPAVVLKLQDLKFVYETTISPEGSAPPATSSAAPASGSTAGYPAKAASPTN